MDRNLIGTVIDGKYRILSLLGEGGGGAVYKAEQFEISRLVAIKILHEIDASKSNDRHRFEREAALLAKLCHENIVSIYAAGLWLDDSFYLVMEFLEGETLGSLLARDERIDETRLVNYGIQLCAAATAAHSVGIIHRDLKPQNIMVLTSPNGDLIKVLDFGLAKFVRTDGEALQKLTSTGQVLGTVNYMSPEMCAGKQADQRSDIYSLGCILYECAAGVPPFEADNPIGLMYKHQYESPPPLSKYNQSVSAEFESVLLKCLRKDPADRYQSAEELSRAFRHLEDRSEVFFMDNVKGKIAGSGFGYRRWAFTLITVVCIVAMAFVSIGSIEALAVGILISLNKPGFAGMEANFAEFLLKNQKRNLAKQLYDHLSDVYASENRSLPALECVVRSLETSLPSGGKQAGVDYLMRKSKLIETLPDSIESSLLLRRIWNLAESCKPKDNKSPKLLTLENDLIMRMLKSELKDEIEPRRWLDSILALAAVRENLDLSNVKTTAIVANAILSRLRVSLNWRDSNTLDRVVLGASQVPDAYEAGVTLQRTRLAVRATSGEKNAPLIGSLALVLSQRHPDEALAILKGIIENGNTLEKLSALSQTAKILLKEKNYLEALHTGDKGESLESELSGNSLPLGWIAATKIEALYHLGRKQAVAQKSAGIVDKLLAVSFRHVPIEPADAGAGFLNSSQHSSQDYFGHFDVDSLMPVLASLIKSKQAEQATRLLKGTINIVNTNDFTISEQSRLAMKALANECEQESVKQLLLQLSQPRTQDKGPI